MKWYAGDIASAISQCTSQKAVLLVYMKDNGELSTAMDAMWADEEVSTFFTDRLCVALQLPVDSVGGQQFSQIYPVLNVPSVYLVGNDGQIKEILPSNTTKEQLIQKCTQHISKRPDPASKSKPAASSSADLTPAESADSGASAAGTDGGEETEAEINANTGYTEEEKEQKIRRARELIQIKQQQKAAEEKEKARNAELERRKLGKDMNKLKEFKAEQEAKETREALRKEKEETRKAREKVREQIAKDREARNAKFQQEKAEKEEALRKRQQEKLQKEAEEAARIAAANSSRARIQFRMPDGSTITHIFEADENLIAVRNFLAAHESNNMGRDFRLAVIYPRRVFTNDDDQTSLRDLNLCPTSALLVLPPAVGGDTPRGTSSATGSVTSLVSLIFSPFLFIWHMIQTFLFATPQTLPPSNQQQQHSSGSTVLKSTSPGGGEASQGGARRRVGRLSDLSPDDEQNTYNGNSTQQM